MYSLLDADVLSQPANKKGHAAVIAWLEENQDDCYTSSIVIAQLALWGPSAAQGSQFGHELQGGTNVLSREIVLQRGDELTITSSYLMRQPLTPNPPSESRPFPSISSHACG
jgi:hypothetical protein